MTRKGLLIPLILLFSLFIVYPENTFSKGGGKGGGKGGTYIGGSGSSHKGGHYFNPSTGNHYKTRGSSVGGGSSQYSELGSRKYKKYYSSPIKFHGSVQRDKNGQIIRSESAKEQYLKSHGYKEGPHGYQVDHIIPLYAGGCDCPSNMELLTIQAHHAKTKADYQKYGR